MCNKGHLSDQWQCSDVVKCGILKPPPFLEKPSLLYRLFNAQTNRHYIRKIGEGVIMSPVKQALLSISPSSRLRFSIRFIFPIELT